MLLKKLKKQKMAIGLVGQKVVIYGDNGTGKTTVALELGKEICKKVSKNPDAAPVVLAFENGTNAADDFYLVDGTDYKNTREILSDFTNEKNRDYILENTPVLIIDGVEKIPTIAKNYVTKKKDIETLGDLGYGKAYDIYKSYTDTPFIKLMSLTGVTIFFIYHDEIEDADTGRVIPSGSGKDSGTGVICKYIRDNSDYAFYVERPTNDDGSKAYSRAYCDDTSKHFGRNRYGEGAETFDVDFNAKSVMDYVEKCGINLAKKKGVDYTTVVEKQEEVTKHMSHDELVDEVTRIGKILFGTSAKERAKEIINDHIAETENGKVSEIEDVRTLEYLLTDLTDLASDRDIDIE